MKKKQRKGFTIVELIIVIAVIGILAAILIPTFSSIIKKANLASAIETAEGMNKALIAHIAEGKGVGNINDVKDALMENGYKEENIQPNDSALEYVWDPAENEIMIIDKDDNTVVYSDNHRGEQFSGTFANSCVYLLSGMIPMVNASKFVDDNGNLTVDDGDTVQVDSTGELAALAYAVNTANSEVKAVEGNDPVMMMEGVTIQLNSDIDISSCSWIPIGTSNRVFAGTFDGNGHTIKGLTILGKISIATSHFLYNNGIPATDKSFGFFGGLSGTFRNVNFTDVNISTKVNSTPAKPAPADPSDLRWMSCFTQFAAGVGVAYPGCTIQNITVGTASDNSVITATNEVGGIVGKTAKCTATDSRITISDCTNYATLTSIFSDSPTKASAGGIIGSIFYSNGTTISNCENYGDVYAATASGIIGSEKSSLVGSTIDITDCANYGDVHGALFAAGVISHIQSNTAPINITNFLQKGDITAKVSKQTYLGRNTKNANTNPMQVAYYNYINNSIVLRAAAVISNGSRTVNAVNVTNEGAISAISADIRSQLVVGDEYCPGVFIDIVAPVGTGALVVPTVVTSGTNVTTELGTYHNVPA